MVTVVTPAYNRAAYLDETIQSVLGQDYPNIEYIVLDDGSTDNTREVLGKYTGRLTWETHPNMGEHRTVNKGWGMAHGEIVVVVSSDDTLLPGAASTAAAFMQAHPEILLACSDWNTIGPHSESLGHVQAPEFGYRFKQDYLSMLRLYINRVGPGAFIRRKAFEIAGMRDPNFRYVADFEYYLRLGLYGELARIPRTLATWRVHPGSATASSTGRDRADEHIRLMEKFYSRPHLPPEVLKVRREAFSSVHLAAAMDMRAERSEARHHYLRSFQYYPPGFLVRPTRLVTGLFLLLPKPLDEVLLRCANAVYVRYDTWVRPIGSRLDRFIKRIGNG